MFYATGHDEKQHCSSMEMSKPNQAAMCGKEPSSAAQVQLKVAKATADAMKLLPSTKRSQ